MGAPNIVRGGSQSGNVAAAELLGLGCCTSCPPTTCRRARCRPCSSSPPTARSGSPTACAGQRQPGAGGRPRRPRRDHGRQARRPGADSAARPARHRGPPPRTPGAGRPRGVPAGRTGVVTRPSAPARSSRSWAPAASARTPCCPTPASAPVPSPGSPAASLPGRRVPARTTSRSARKSSRRHASAAPSPCAGSAHGLWYGIPALADDAVHDGRVVVANVSRVVVGELAARYRRLVVVRVTASDEVRAQRLRARRREPEPGVGQRLARPDPAPATASTRSSQRRLARGGRRNCSASSATRPVARSPPGRNGLPVRRAWFTWKQEALQLCEVVADRPAVSMPLPAPAISALAGASASRRGGGACAVVEGDGGSRGEAPECLR